MLNTTETLLLRQLREYYYSIDWACGEVFDSNLVDSLSEDSAPTFQDCITLAREDTDYYLRLQKENQPNLELRKPYYDA